MGGTRRQCITPKRTIDISTVLSPNVREEGVRDKGRGHLTNAWIVAILRGDKEKESDPIESGKL